MTGESFIDVDFCQRAKTGQVVSGDVFLSRKIKEEGRIISVLSDGLGSGVKASVLANLTATMALRYTSAFVDVRKSAGTIMDTLPDLRGAQDQLLHFHHRGPGRTGPHAGHRARQPRPGAAARPDGRCRWNGRTSPWRTGRTAPSATANLTCSWATGLSASPTASASRGWAARACRWAGAATTSCVSCRQQVAQEPEISSQELARKVVAEALVNDGGRRQGRHDLRRGLLPPSAPAAGDHRAAVLQGARRGVGRDGRCISTGARPFAAGPPPTSSSRLLNRPVRRLPDQT